MSVYFVTGKLGSGKGLTCVGKIQEYVRQRRRVATNMDLFMEHLAENRRNKQAVIRLPDKPRISDLEMIGYGCEKEDYSGKRFGLLVLDELGTWFNARSWNDKERAAVIDWFLHARKYRWDVILQVQSVSVIDKQLLESLGEHVVVCKRMDALPIPIIGTLIAFLFGARLRLPRFHLGIVFYGRPPNGQIVDRWWQRGTGLFKAYRTGQVFESGMELIGGELVDMRAPYSYLSRWHLDGRYARPPWWQPLVVHLKPVAVYLWAVIAAPVSAATGRSPAAVLTAWGVAAPREPRRLQLHARDYFLAGSSGLSAQALAATSQPEGARHAA